MSKQKINRIVKKLFGLVVKQPGIVKSPIKEFQDINSKYYNIILFTLFYIYTHITIIRYTKYTKFILLILLNFYYFLKHKKVKNWLQHYCEENKLADNSNGNNDSDYCK